jgi:hypothetical protein
VKFAGISDDCNAISEGVIVDRVCAGNDAVAGVREDGAGDVHPAMPAERSTKTAMKIITRVMDCFVMCMHTTGERLMFARFPRGIPVPGVGGAGPGTFFFENVLERFLKKLFATRKNFRKYHTVNGKFVKIIFRRS